MLPSAMIKARRSLLDVVNTGKPTQLKVQQEQYRRAECVFTVRAKFESVTNPDARRTL